MNATLEEIVKKVEKYSFDLVQLHGDESPEFCLNLKRHYEESIDEVISTNKEKLLRPARNENQIKIIKVFSIKNDFNFDQLKPYEAVCDFFLFDTKGQLPGGNGYTFDWEVLKDYPSTKPYFLSGGIGLDQVEKILEFLKREASRYCHAIDINSKFETEPGLKDLEKLTFFKKEMNLLNS